MKRIFTTLCALALVTAGVLPALAAESPAPSQQPELAYCYQRGGSGKKTASACMTFLTGYPAGAAKIRIERN